MLPKKITVLLILFIGLKINAQEIIKYDHCNCIETIEYSEEDNALKHGKYELICENTVIEKGQYANGLKDGNWTVQTDKGIVVSSINYNKGKLNGSFELFYYKGKPKLKASFKNNLPSGEWNYLSDKGKVLKQGLYLDGKPSGVWKNYKKKKINKEYNFDTKKFNTNKEIKKKKSYLPRDDETGEYIIIYYPERNVKTVYQPLEGYLQANELFIDLLNVPTTLMNTYTHYDFNISANILEGIFSVDSIEIKSKISYQSGNPSLPFIAKTNYPKNLKKINHTALLKAKMEERIFETIMVLGPWITDKDLNFNIHVPFVLNEIK